VNIFLFVLGAGTMTPMILLAVSISVLIVIATIAINDRMASANTDQAGMSRESVSIDPTQWGSYEKRMVDEST
jgi:hypothetical protein